MSEAPTRLAKEQLTSIVERAERLIEEKKAIGDDLKEVFAEAKANGYDVKQLRRVIKNRAVEPADRSEQNAIYNVYWKALGHDAEEPAYVAIAAAAGEKLGRDEVMATLQKLVPAGVTFDMNFGRGDKVRIRRLDDGTAVVEPIEDEPAKPPAEARPGKTVKRPATVLKMVPKDSVKDAADRAEEAARAKSKKPGDEGSLIPEDMLEDTTED